MIWRHPLAWLGLATLLIPIAIHLLVRQQAEPLAFPSLRFLQTSRLAAVRRRSLSDWLLLAVRLLILLAAVAALADPFFTGASRRAAWASRVTRAIIVDTPDASADAGTGAAARDDADATAAANALIAAARQEQTSAHASTVISSDDLSVGLARAVAWQATAPPAAREIVIVSALTRDRIAPSLFDTLPPHVGLRFVRVGPTLDTRSVDGRPASLRALSPRTGPAVRAVGIAAAGSGAAGSGAAGSGAAAAGAEASGSRSADSQNLDSRVVEARAFETRVPGVVVRPDSTMVQWRGSASAARAADAARTGVSVGAAGGGPATPGTLDIVSTADTLSVPALGLRIEVDARDLPAARAALDAVLAEGIPVVGQTMRPLQIALGAGASRRIAGSRGGLQPLASPWMANALRTVASDTALRDASAIDADAADRVDADGASGGADDRNADRSDNGDAARNAHARANDNAAADASHSGQTRGDAAGAGTSRTPPLVVLTDRAGRAIVTAAARRTPASSAAAANAPALVLLSTLPAASDASALLLRSALRATAAPDPLPHAEIVRLTDAQLAAWQRPAALPPLEELTGIDTHDRRWFWGAALILLLVERILRARMRRSEPADATEVPHAA